MSIDLHWWYLPVALAVVGVVLMLMTRCEGHNFPMPTWHLGAGIAMLGAALCIAIGGWLS